MRRFWAWLTSLDSDWPDLERVNPYYYSFPNKRCHVAWEEGRRFGRKEQPETNAEYLRRIQYYQDDYQWDEGHHIW